MGRLPARLRSLLTFGLSDLILSLQHQLMAADAANSGRAVAGAAALERLQSDLGELRRELAALKSFVAAQGDWEQMRLRASLSSALNIVSLLPQLRIDGVLPPFTPQGFEITGEVAAYLFHLVRRQRPRLVLELGSGSSTIIFAAAARENGCGRVISVEHDSVHAERTRHFLASAGLTDWATLVEVPLTQQRFGAHSLQWYDLQPLLSGLAEKIDLLFVDGPPGKVQPLSRYPAGGVLGGHMAARGVAFIDDGGRSDEARMIEMWREEGLVFEAEVLDFLPRSPVLLRFPGEPGSVAELRPPAAEATADRTGPARDRRSAS